MSEIGNLIKKLAETHEEIYLKVARVDKVDSTERMCDVTPLDGSTQILGVRLQAGEGDETGIVLLPRKDSLVVVGFFNNHSACVLLTGELDQVDLKIDDLTASLNKEGMRLEFDGQKMNWTKEGMKMELKSGKYSFKNEAYSLKDALKELMEAIKKITVTTAVGPSGVPVNVADFVTIEQKLEKLLQ